VSRYYSIDDANALLPELAAVIERLRGQREELVDLRNAFENRQVEVHGGPDGHADADAPGQDPAPEQDDPELRRLRLRMRGIVDQMSADVAWLDQRSIVLRDIATGLLDFPALASGREVWLCWRSGEPGIGFWHGQEEGFAGRRPLAQLPDAARA
jgi:hypothetical protein